jgi:hypothetical protein
MSWIQKIGERVADGDEATRARSERLLAELLTLPPANRRTVGAGLLEELTPADKARFLESLSDATQNPAASADVLSHLLEMPPALRRKAPAALLEQLSETDRATLEASLTPPPPVPTGAVPPLPARPVVARPRLGPPPKPRIVWPMVHALAFGSWLAWSLPRNPLVLAAALIAGFDLYMISINQWGGINWQWQWLHFYWQYPDRLINALYLILS